MGPKDGRAIEKVEEVCMKASANEEQRFESCQTYCNGSFHTTSCAAKRGMRPSKMRRKWNNKSGNKLVGMLRPFLFSAVGRGIKGDDEILNDAIQELYAAAVDASFLTTKIPEIGAEIAAIRQRLGR